MTRIGLVQIDNGATSEEADNLAIGHSPARDALAAAIERHAQIQAALDENVAAQTRADGAVLDARDAIDAAAEAVAAAKAADAHAVARGQPGGATKLARAQLQDAEDALEAAKAAQKMLADEQADLDNKLAFSRLNQALAAVVREDPSTRKLIAEFRAAQARLHDLYGALAELAKLNNALPEQARFWNATNWTDDLPPSSTAPRVRDWLARLKSDASATFVE